jgi:hypothetical protein
VATRRERRPRRATPAPAFAIDAGNRADLVAGVAGLVLLIAMFLPWFGPSEQLADAIREADQISREAGGQPVESPDVTDNAWQAFGFLDIVLLVTALVGVRAGIAALARPGGRSATGVTAVTAGLGTLASLLVLYRVVDPIGEAGREYGIFIGLLAAVGIAAGGWLGLERGAGVRNGAQVDSVASRRDG